MRESLKRGNKKGDSESDKKRGEQMKDFMSRSGKKDAQKPGDQPQGKDGKQGDKAGDGDPKKEGEGKANKDGMEGDGKKNDKPSDVAGKGEGDRTPGDERKMDSQRIDVKADGKEGNTGESKSEIIRGASDEGFASREYKEVYGDYEDVVEEVMEKENVPKGYRYYVKRYFQLIKPREQE